MSCDVRGKTGRGSADSGVDGGEKAVPAFLAGPDQLLNGSRPAQGPHSDGWRPSAPPPAGLESLQTFLYTSQPW